MDGLSRRKLAAAALWSLSCSPPTDWRIEPCVGEDDAACLVEQISVDGEERSYLVSRLGGYECPAEGLALVLFFHGSAGNGASERVQLNTTWEDLTLEETVGGEALFVYPDGLPHRDCGRKSSCWDRDPQGRDVAFFDALLEEVSANYCVDTDRVYAMGHSRGGRFVEVLGCERSADLAGIAMVAVGADNVESCSGSVPAYISHGVDDQTIAFEQGWSHVENWADRNGCEVPSPGAPVGECVDIRGCDAPVRWCPTAETDWEGHAVPGLFDETVWPFPG